MMIKVAENLHDYIVPLAQPVWCNLPPHLSFARLLKHLNPERALTREVTRTLWLGSCPGLAKEAVRAASNLADEIVSGADHSLLTSRRRC